MRTLFVVAALGSIVGCASTPAPVATAVASATTASVAPAKERGSLGSRLSNQPSDRTVKSVGNQSFRDESSIRSMGNEVGARGQ